MNLSNSHDLYNAIINEVKNKRMSSEQMIEFAKSINPKFKTRKELIKNGINVFKSKFYSIDITPVTDWYLGEAETNEIGVHIALYRGKESLMHLNFAHAKNV